MRRKLPLTLATICVLALPSTGCCFGATNAPAAPSAPTPVIEVPAPQPPAAPVITHARATSSMGLCLEFSPANYATLGAEGAAAAARTADPAARVEPNLTCPTENIIGTCTLASHVWYAYAGGYFVGEGGPSTCRTMGGRWAH